MAFLRKNKNRTRKPRNIPFTYLILNIKISSNNRQGEEAYRQVMQDIYNNALTAPIGKGKRAFLRTMFPADVEGNQFYYGTITRFTDLENSNWVNIHTRAEVTLELESGLYPNRQDADYVFIPQAHRFALRLTPDFTIKNAQDFFEKTIKDIIRPDEDYTVIIQQSKGIYEEIYNAISVEKLSISVSYTNSDSIGDDAAEWLDDQLKESNIKQANLMFESGKHETINLGTKLIKGGLDLAIENGEVQAKIKDASGKTKRVITKDHPEKNRSSTPSEEELKSVIFKEVMQRYRNNNE